VYGERGGNSLVAALPLRGLRSFSSKLVEALMDTIVPFGKRDAVSMYPTGGSLRLRLPMAAKVQPITIHQPNLPADNHSPANQFGFAFIQYNPATK